MGDRAAAVSDFMTWLALGRVSNLPTVWTNTLAGAVLCGGTNVNSFIAAGLALTLFYLGGMFLNDAFDAEFDALHRPSRPIAAGLKSRNVVFSAGFALLAAGVAVCFCLNARTGAAAVLLATAIVLYDWRHKGNALSPFIMGTCRFLSYAVAGLAVGALTSEASAGGIGLWLYVAGLTFAARQEAFDGFDNAWPLLLMAVPPIYAASQAIASGSAVTLILLAAFVAWSALALRLLFRRSRGDVPRAVVCLIAGICLYDATLIAATGRIELAVVAALGCPATLALQRIAPGT